MSQTISITGKRSFYERVVLGMLSKMDQGQMTVCLPSGEMITIGNGNGINAALEIKNPDFFRRCVLFGDIGFGEAYVEGLWDTTDIAAVIKWFILNIDQTPGASGSKVKNVFLNILKVFNHIYHFKRTNSLDGSRKNISEHYDLNNDFFALFLDPSMTYSSAYFREKDMSLQQAQIEKYDRLCQQLHLKPADHVLEIGTGWGGNAIHIAGKYGCKVTTATISREQFNMTVERVRKAGLSDKVEVVLRDYRLLDGEFDKIVSIEMLEAVGHEFLEVYFRKCHELLKKDGILAFQVITCPDSRYESLRKGVDWIQKHIFPGSLLPSVGAINTAVNNTSDLTLVDLKDIGLHYAKTLSIWRERFNAEVDRVKDLGFDDRFIRKWNYYLSYCEAAFEMRNINVMQMVYARPNNTSR